MVRPPKVRLKARRSGATEARRVRRDAILSAVRRAGSVALTRDLAAALGVSRKALPREVLMAEWRATVPDHEDDADA